MRKFLIHLLGGKTKQEMLQSNRQMVKQGELLALYMLKDVAERLYGHQDWAQCMYKTITEMIKEAKGK